MKGKSDRYAGLTERRETREKDRKFTSVKCSINALEEIFDFRVISSSISPPFGDDTARAREI